MVKIAMFLLVGRMPLVRRIGFLRFSATARFDVKGWPRVTGCLSYWTCCGHRDHKGLALKDTGQSWRNHLLLLPSPIYQQKSSFMGKFRAAKPPHKADNVSPDLAHVYTYSFFRYLQSAYASFSVVTPLFCASAVVELVRHMNELPDILFDPNQIYLGGLLMTLFSIGMWIAVRGTCRRSFVTLYYDSDREQFTAVTYDLLLRKTKTVFQAGDATALDVSGPFGAFKGNLLIHGKQYYVNLPDFRSVRHYNFMLEKPTHEEFGNSED